MSAEDPTIEELETRYNELVKKHSAVTQSKNRVDAELSVQKRALKKIMDDCREAGYDPDKLQDEMKRLKEVLVTKMNVFAADLDAAENILRPMIREIEKG